MSETKPQVCIIGAGPAGLAAARNLKLRGIPYTQFEKHSGVGGIWDIENPGSPMYESAHFISSRSVSGYYGYPMSDSYPDYPGQKLVLEYTKDFAEAYGLSNRVNFSTGVEAVVPFDKQWRVITEKGAEHIFSHVICASGHTWTPNIPAYEGEFSGNIIHSVEYREASIFKGKRVLIIGAGNSACDIACDAAASADAAFISMRRGYHFIPKHIFGMPADVFGARSKWMPFKMRRFFFEQILRTLNGDLTRYGLQAPDHRILASHPIVNSQLLHYLQHGDIGACVDIERFDGHNVVFKNGQKEKIDLIVFATGYKYEIPYVERTMFDWKNDKPNLAYTIYNRRHPTLFAAGFTEMNAGGYYIFDEMTSLIAEIIGVQQHNPELWQRIKNTFEKPTEFSGSLGMVQSQRHSDYVDMDTYIAECRKLRKEMGWRDVRRSLENMKPTDVAVQLEAE